MSTGGIVGSIRFIVISDGMPDAPSEAFAVARTYRNHIDVVYVGPEERPAGRDFLEQLARISGGTTVTADRVKALGSTIQLLLEAT